MANTKITELTQLTNPVSTDVLPIVDVGADVTKKISIADLLKNAAAGTVDAAGLAFDGDGNTGLYKPASDQLAVTTGGSQALLIDGSGNITAAGTSTADSFIPTSSTVPSNGLYLAAANSIAIATNSSQRLLIDGSGNLTIDGTASIVGPTGNTNLVVTGKQSLATTANWNFPHLSVKRSSTNAADFKTISLLLDGDSDSSTDLYSNVNFVLRTDSAPTTGSTSAGLNAGLEITAPATVRIGTNGSERFRVASDGDVGIGVTDPQAKLHINGNILADSTLGPSTITSTSNWNYGHLYLTRNASNTSQAKMLSMGLNADGWADTNLTNQLNIWGTYSGTPTTGSTTSGLNGVMNFGAPNALAFHTNTSERVRVDSSGRLLVGTSSDGGGALLQVNGNRIRVATAKTPASASDTGTAGEICWDASYIYVCTATNTWKRTALSTW